MLRPSVKPLQQSVPVILRHQGVGVHLTLRNRHQDFVVRYRRRLEFKRRGVLAKPDQVLPAFAFADEFEQPLAQKDRQRNARECVGGE